MGRRRGRPPGDPHLDGDAERRADAGRGGEVGLGLARPVAGPAAGAARSTTGAPSFRTRSPRRRCRRASSVPPPGSQSGRARFRAGGDEPGPVGAQQERAAPSAACPMVLRAEGAGDASAGFEHRVETVEQGERTRPRRRRRRAGSLKGAARGAPWPRGRPGGAGPAGGDAGRARGPRWRGPPGGGRPGAGRGRRCRPASAGRRSAWPFKAASSPRSRRAKGRWLR